MRLFADDPAVAERIARLYGEILADEVGHVASSPPSSPALASITRFFAQEIAWRSIVGSVPEIPVLFGAAELRRLLRQRFDVRREVETFAGRAYAAAAL